MLVLGLHHHAGCCLRTAHASGSERPKICTQLHAHTSMTVLLPLIQPDMIERATC